MIASRKRIRQGKVNHFVLFSFIFFSSLYCLLISLVEEEKKKQIIVMSLLK
jgi:hypothetical protein